MRGATNHLGVFDLKGSMVNRIVHGKVFKKTATLKDRNLLAMNQENIWLRFREKDRKLILHTMRKDSNLLHTYNMMDYSLLLCIQDNPAYQECKIDLLRQLGNQSVASMSTANSEFNKTLLNMVEQKFIGNRHLFLSACGKYMYHIGIIDYLQDYNLDKKIENFLKYRLKGDGDGISAMPPPFYADRFLRFMRDHVIIDQKKGNAKNKEFLRVTSSKKSL